MFKKRSFHDASNHIGNGTNSGSMDLKSAISEVNIAINLFFNNQFAEAKKLTAERSSTSMYHAIGYSTLLFLEAAMTFEAEDINAAMNSIKSSIQVCNRFRKKENLASSFGKMIGVSHTELTEDELHAELIFAELNLYRAALTFIQDENLISFIRGALKIRLGYQTYNNCNKLSEKMEKTQYNMHFIGGVLLGCGAFNIGLSLLPPRILSLLKWIGFTANKSLGKKQLIEGYSTPNLRSSIISLFILGYNLFLTVHLGTNDADLERTEVILKEVSTKFPNGVFFHLFAGRLHQMNGDFDSAIDNLKKAESLQSQWKQFSHICYWELMWCHAFKMEWNTASQYAELLRLESNWSKCVYTYLRAVFLIMSGQSERREEINDLLRSVPDLKRRFAGKSVPIEKMVARKSRKFFEQGEFLILPAHEMLYAWNGLTMLKGNSDLRSRHLEKINEAKDSLEERKLRHVPSSDNQFNYFDDYCLVQLLRGACFRYNNEPMQAELCFTDVKENYSGINKDHYLAPAALSDLAWMLIEQERYDEAGTYLKYIRKTYSHYSMESRLHFRMHAAQSRVNLLMSKPGSSSS